MPARSAGPAPRGPCRPTRGQRSDLRGRRETPPLELLWPAAPAHRPPTARRSARPAPPNIPRRRTSQRSRWRCRGRIHSPESSLPWRLPNPDFVQRHPGSEAVKRPPDLLLEALVHLVRFLARVDEIADLALAMSDACLASCLPEPFLQDSARAFPPEETECRRERAL